MYVILLYQKLSIHFREGKTKNKLFGTKHKLNYVGCHDTGLGAIRMKNYDTERYFAAYFNRHLSGKPTILNVIDNFQNST